MSAESPHSPQEPLQRAMLWLREPGQCIRAILLAGFAVRMIWWSYAQTVPVSDFQKYRRFAEVLLNRGWFGRPDGPSAEVFPGYPVFLAGLMTISDSGAWLALWSILLSTALILLVYAVTVRLTSSVPVGLIAAAICAFNPTFVFFAPVLATEHLFSVLLLGAILAVYSALEDESPGATAAPMIAGLLMGLATLTRGEGLFMAAVPVLILLASWRRGLRRIWSILLPFSIAFVLSVLPWFMRNTYVIGPGASLSTSGGINLYFAHNPYQYGYQSWDIEALEGLGELDTHLTAGRHAKLNLQTMPASKVIGGVIEGTKRLYIYGGGYSVTWSTTRPKPRHEVQYVPRTLPGLRLFTALTGAYYILGVLAFCSLFYLKKQKLATWMCLYGIILMNWMCYAVVFWAKPRYRYTAEIAICILAAMMVHLLIERARQRKAGAET